MSPLHPGNGGPEGGPRATGDLRCLKSSHLPLPMSLPLACPGGSATATVPTAASAIGLLSEWGSASPRNLERHQLTISTQAS